MSKNNLSISQRLKKTQKPEVKREIVDEWVNNWRTQYDDLTRRLGRAIANDDYDNTCILAGEIKGASQKFFDALPRVIDAVSAK